MERKKREWRCVYEYMYCLMWVKIEFISMDGKWTKHHNIAEREGDLECGNILNWIADIYTSHLKMMIEE